MSLGWSQTEPSLFASARLLGLDDAGELLRRLRKYGLRGKAVLRL
jgi:hypothetical protein